MAPERPRVTVRVRLTAMYGLLFVATVAILLAISYWLMERHLTRTLPAELRDSALDELLFQYAIALAGATLVALALGWAIAGRALAPVARMTATARRITQDRLDERIALDGPDDELRELGDTIDEMLDRLTAAFEAQRRFVANASHELRSPLTVIRTEADVALANPDAGTEELRAMGEAVIEATDRTDALLESLLLLARSQRGMLARDPVDLAIIARAALSALNDEATDAGVLVRGNDLRSAPVTGDRRLLERLCENLVENGVRYNVRGGWVDVHTARPERGGGALLTVSNTGPKIAPEALARLLEPFERGARHGDRRGAGLGLSIVRSVAEAHGGVVTLEARDEGGLTVTVRLPSAPPG